LTAGVVAVALLPAGLDKSTCIDILMRVDVRREIGMRTLLKRSKARAVVEFCERCGAVCDAACRISAIIDWEHEKVLLWGVRPPR
jgi:hypothetical protein